MLRHIIQTALIVVPAYYIGGIAQALCVSLRTADVAQQAVFLTYIGIKLVVIAATAWLTWRGYEPRRTLQ